MKKGGEGENNKGRNWAKWSMIHFLLLGMLLRKLRHYFPHNNQNDKSIVADFDQYFSANWT